VSFTAPESPSVAVPVEMSASPLVPCVPAFADETEMAPLRK